MRITTQMKRAFALALAVVMAAALLVCPAAAASAPWVQIDGKGTGSQTVSLQGLTEEARYTSVQITLNLDRTASGISFAGAVADDGQSYATARQEGNSLTLYVTSKVFLNQGETLTLGTLTADADFTVVSASGLKLLNVTADPTDPNNKEIIIPDVSIDGGASPDPEPNPGSGSGQAAARYAVTAASGITGGSLSFSTARASQGQTVTVTATPDTGYTLSAVTVTGKADQTVAVTDQKDGTWTFVMPGCDVTVDAVFVPEDRPLPFTDVGEKDWFQEAVAYVYRTGLMNGTDSTTFSPAAATTRGMVVTILHRYEGSPEAAPAGFSDVLPAQYYAGAVAWAAANGVVNGYDGGVFKPDQAITREQMAAILYRYAQYKGMDVSGRADLSAYSDADRISGYALDAMAWANHAGLISGMEDHTLRPQGSATRAQVATILMRFCQSLEAE